MNKLTLCLYVFLASCGGDDFTDNKTQPTSDAGQDTNNQPDTNSPDVGVDSTLDSMSESGEDVVVDSSVPEVGEDVVVDSSVPEVGEDSSGCTPGEMTCQGKVPHWCNPDGTWDIKPECPYLCTEGLCTGECVPGTQQCLTDNVEFCNASGNWEFVRQCPVNCVQDECYKVWCCKDNFPPQDIEDCVCNAYQQCDVTTGMLDSCPANLNCCWISIYGDCTCTDYYTENACVQITSEPTVMRVDSCPAKITSP